MIKTKEEIEKEFYNKFSFIQAIKNEKSGNAYTRVIDFIHQIRQDDLEEVKKIIKEKGLHLGYGNDILDKLDNLNK